MDLDYRQTRRLYLAGAVPFPVQFPDVGTISYEMGELAHSPYGHKEAELMVIVREQSDLEHATTRVILAKHVAAIFIFAGEGIQVDDLENGTWLLGPYVSNDPQKMLEQVAMSEQVTADAAGRGHRLRGIVFVQEDQPVLTINEITQPAGCVSAYRRIGGYCQCESHVYCQCEN